MKHFLTLIILVLAFSGCSKKATKPIEKGAIYFEAVSADSSNVTFANTLIQNDDINIIEYLYYYNGGGVAIGDINNDGLEDIYFTANQTPDKLYLNLGNLKFKDITKNAGIIIDSTWSTGVTMEDVNNDGLLDIYVSKVGNYKSLKAKNQLYLNNGDQTFTESALGLGLAFSGFSTQASFFDYDNDGDMDMYLLNHAVHTPRSYGDTRIRRLSDSLSGDKLFENKLNEGQMIFEDVSKKSGIYSSALGYGLALKTSDINKDGWIDIYVGNDFHENDYLYINQGDKTFKEASAVYLNHTSRFTMGVDIADINNDARPDIFSLDMMPFDKEIFLKSGGEDTDKVSQIKKSFGFETQYARNTFQLNRDNTSFTDVALMTNTHATDWSWSILINDFDNDGLNDLYITNGIYKRPNDLNYINYLSNINFAKYDQTKQNDIEKKLIKEMPTVNLSNVVFKNKGNLEFSKLTESAGLSPSYSNGSAYSDLDNDGDLDLAINNINQEALILENKSEKTKSNSFISLSLKGNTELKNISGTKVYVYVNNKTHYKELSTTKGFQSSSSRKLHFGLGNASKIDSLKIEWLDGKTQIEKEIDINEHITLKRSNNIVATTISKVETKYVTFPFVHIENNYNDYDKEVLIPEKLSREGPTVVKSDFNNDGLEDLFIGNAKYQSPALYIQQKNGKYKNSPGSALRKDAIYEDVDVISIDLENDGDLDLYVMSGGNNNLENNKALEDRIYINDGKANFTRLKASLIKTNGGSISSGDINNDGFMDLFIGNRSIPGGYGLSPYSYILKNNKKGGFEIAQKHRFGMVTDSKWADLNNDGFQDLILVGDWMPITVLINKGDNTFENQTKKYGLKDSQGLWNTVAIEDIDNNGFKDIIAGNAGKNLKWKASKDQPIKLFLDDFDNNSQPDPIIFYNFFGNNVPFASKDLLAQQLPSLKKKFLDYEKFSKISSIEELTEKPEADILETKTISELRSMVYFNEGESFTGQALPKEAQMSSIEDIIIEKNGNKTQLIFVGNFLDYTTELGESASNSGGILSLNNSRKIEFFKLISIPPNLNARRVVKLDEKRFLVIANNDKSYVFEIE